MSRTVGKRDSKAARARLAGQQLLKCAEPLGAGLETKNIITGNLGANTRQLFVGLNSDATPSTYWLVNGDNYVERNIAAGSTHYG